MGKKQSTSQNKRKTILKYVIIHEREATMNQITGWLIGIIATAIGSIITGLIVGFWNKHKNRYIKGAKMEKEEQIGGVVEQRLIPVKNDIKKLSNNIEQTNRNLQELIAVVKQQNENISLIKTGVQASQKSLLRDTLQKCLEKGFRTYEDMNEVDKLYSTYEKLGSNNVTNSLLVAFQKLPIKRTDLGNIKINMTKREYELHKQQYFEDLL